MIILENCTVFDGHSEELLENGCVVIENGRIREVSGRARVKDADRIDGRGGFLMPGLIDCHFHAYTPSFDIHALDRMPMSLLSQHAAAILEGALQRGFTTVRDAGGGDIGLALALQRGLIKGPRFFFSGKAITQTGGHGDMRPADQIEPCGCGYRGALTRIADGADEVRHAVRDELRKGATQIKIFVSGGVVSPTDPLWMPQFTDEEIRAAVEEAATRRTYVMAHCHTDERAKVCARLGVRSIEHGTEILPDTAKLIARAGTFVVPTMSVAGVLRDKGKGLGLPPASLGKIAGLFESMQRSVETCAHAGVKLGLGTDLLGDFHSHQGDEFPLRGEVQKPIDVLRSATSVNAEILQKSGELGCIGEGALADLILVDGNPLGDLSLLADAARHVKLIIRNGEIVKNTI